MISAVTSAAAPPTAGPYSPGVSFGNLLFLAGQGPFDSAGQRVGVTFAEQARQTFANLQAVAEAGGSSLHNALRITVYLKDLSDFETMNEVSREFLSEPFPARTTLRVGLSGFDIEVDAIVAVPDEAGERSN